MIALPGSSWRCRSSAMPYDEAMLRYGSDRPDRRLRNGDPRPRCLPRLGVQGLPGALVRRGGAGLKASGEFPRSRFDKLTERAQVLGAKGLVWGRWSRTAANGAPRWPSSCPTRRSGANDALGAGAGDAVLIVADHRRRWRREVLGELRSEVADTGASRDNDLFWVVDFPMFEWNEDESRWDPLHHPVHLRPTGDLEGDPGTVAEPRLRRGLERLGARRGLDPYQPPGRPAEGLRRAWHRRRTRRASASASCSRRSATARRRTAGSRSGSTAWVALLAGRELDPRRDRLPQGR